MPVITNVEDLRALAEKGACRACSTTTPTAARGPRAPTAPNESDFRRKIPLRQRVAVNMENRTTATTMAGRAVKMPVAIAPVGLTACSTPTARSTPRAAGRSSASVHAVDDEHLLDRRTSPDTPSAPFWFQLYMMRDRDAMARMIDRCKPRKCSALVLTLDLQVIGQRHKDRRTA